MLFRIFIPLLICGVLALACGSSPMNAPEVELDPAENNSAIIDTIDTVDGCDEAEQIAVVLSGELTAPWALLERLRRDLSAIRAGWLDSVPACGIEFFPPWLLSHVSAGVTGTVYAAIKDGSYRDWDLLNELYDLDSVDTGHCYGSACRIGLQFTGCQNSLRLAAAYDSLPGFTYCEASGLFGDWSMLLCHEVSDQMVYFFRNAWGDCPAGCIYSTLDIFTAVGGGIVYYGHISDREELVEPWATWFKEAWNRYHDRDTWSFDDRPTEADGPVQRP